MCDAGDKVKQLDNWAIKVVKYFRIEDSFDDKSRWRLGDPKVDGVALDPRFFTKCKRYTGNIVLDVPIEKGVNPLDFTLGPFDMPVVTQRLGEMIESLAPAEIQRVPIRIGRFGDYEILNILTLRDAIDEKLSEISRWEEKDGRPEKIGQYFAIGELVLNEKKINHSKILRLKDWKLPLIVCETIKQSLEKFGATGISFKELKCS